MRKRHARQGKGLPENSFILVLCEVLGVKKSNRVIPDLEYRLDY